MCQSTHGDPFSCSIMCIQAVLPAKPSLTLFCILNLRKLMAKVMLIYKNIKLKSLTMFLNH